MPGREREARFRRALAVAGRFDSGTGDLATRHDEIAGESEGLSAEDRERLKESLDDIGSDSPGTQAAASRLGRIAATVRGPTGVALQELITEIAADAAKKTLLGGP